MDKSKDKTIIEIWEFINNVLVNHETKEMPQDGFLLKDTSCPSLLENMGIGLITPMYIEVNKNQDKNDEYKKITKFLKKYLEYYAKKNNLLIEDLDIDFINYGKTELVYVMTDKNGKKLTLLVKQPALKLGKVYEEMQNLLELNEKDKNVIAPIDYFQLGDQELCVTPYIKQARCIASYCSWGVYIPEPYYRFERFSKEQEQVVNACMIAKIISLYDFEKQEGLSNCKLDGGDFMLHKDWEKKKPTIEDTLNQLYLIAARKKVKCSFKRYLELIKNESLKVNVNAKKSNLVINLSEIPMNVEDVEKGINIGKEIIKFKSKKL